MNRYQSFLILVSITLLFSCAKQKTMKGTIDESLIFSAKQYSLLADVMKNKADLLPRTIDGDGNLVTDSSRAWISGFFPGSMWYLYEATKEQKFLDDAKLFNARIEKENYTPENHDVGFLLFSSFGNGLRLTGDKQYNEILLTGAKSLTTRFNPKIGCVKS